MALAVGTAVVLAACPPETFARQEGDDGEPSPEPLLETRMVASALLAAWTPPMWVLLVVAQLAVGLLGWWASATG